MRTFAVKPVQQQTATGKLTNQRSSRASLRSWALAPLLFLTILSGGAFAATPAMAEFGLQRFAISARNQNGTPDVQAGSHPYALTTTFLLPEPEWGLRHIKDVRLELPPGFVGDPNATPKCSYQQFIRLSEGASRCPNETVVGVAATYFGYVGESSGSSDTPDPVYNLVPPSGVAAEFAFLVAKRTPVFLQTSARTGSDYGLTTNVSDINEQVQLVASKVTIWGVPADPAHNEVRGSCVNEILGSFAGDLKEPGSGLLEAGEEDELEGPIHNPPEERYPVGITGAECPTGAPALPLLTNPTSCGVPRAATLSVDSWEEPGVYYAKRAQLPEIEGCGKLDFSPTLTVTPDKPDASTSSGLTVNVKVPQETALNPVGLTEADVRNTTVMLPPGVALNPAGANGLEACSSNPGALASDQLGSAGDGIGFKGFENPPLESGVSLPIFSPALPGSIPAEDSVSAGSIDSGEDVLQPGLNFCPNASKIGTVRIKTPLLEHELTGAIYLAAQEANPFGSLMAIYFVAEDPVAGVLVKLPGEVSLCKGAGEVIAGQKCQALGQIVTTLLNTPQLPFEEFEAHFFGGEKAPLTTPAACGTYTTEASFAPWTGAPAAHPAAAFQIEHGPNGGPCPGSSLPFNPSLTGGALNVNAGAFSPFTLTMNRSDGEQNIQSVEAHLPPGLAGILANVELCPEPQANLGECGPNSLIGETTVSVGVGGDPYTVTGGKFYLTGPYNGTGACTTGTSGCAPFGISFVVPAKAGPFDLEHTKSFSPACDCILVRGKIEVDPLTAAITITSNPPGTPGAIPTSIEGIPLEIQHINATTTRGNFQFNPTNCNKMEVTGTIHSSEGGTDSIGVPFQVTNCQALKFEPKLAVSTQAKTSRANGASLTFKFTNPNAAQGTQANYAKFKVELPEQLPSRLTTLQKACTAAQFNANPSGCPAASVVGHMKVATPVLPVPLEGPLYFVSNGGEAFPNLIVVLQGYGVTARLVGDTFISKAGITSSTFKAVPDFPFSSAEVTLPEGPYSALTTAGSLCAPTTTRTVVRKVTVRVRGHKKTETRRVAETVAAPLVMPTEFVAQNGAEIHESTPIDVTGCAKAVHPKKKAAKHTRKAGKKR
jgi:hypothetical protein